MPRTKMASSSSSSSMAIVQLCVTKSSVAILRTKGKAAILDTRLCLLSSPCKSARAALHLAVSCQALKIVAPATEVWIYFSVQATLTTTKSPAIPDTLLGCQSCRTCQNSYRTTGFCEAEDKAEPLNKSQIHNPTAFIHLAFPLSPSPSRPVQAGSYSSNHLQSLFPGPRQTILFFTISLLTQKQLAEFGGVERGRADRVETAPTPDTALYPFYCSGNTFLLFHVAAKTTIRSLQQVAL